MRTTLTNAAIDRLIRAGTEDTLYDAAAPGLQLRLRKRSAMWSVQFMTNGRRYRVTIGPYPKIGVSAARAAAVQAKDDVAATGVAGDENARQRPSKATETPKTKVLWESFLRASEWDTERNARNSVAAVLGEALEADPATLALHTLQRAIDAYPAPSYAANAARYFRPFLKWAAKRGYTPAECALIEQPRGSTKARNRVLTPDELRAILPALDVRNDHDAVVLLLFYTCLRRGEVEAFQWEWFSPKLTDVRIPPEANKMGYELSIPLPDEAAAVLCSRYSDGAVGPVFKKLHNWSRWQMRFMEVTGTSNWHRHDIRRTGATILGELGTDPHVIEAVLGHKHLIGSNVATIYNRSRYSQEHMEALRKLSQYYKSIKYYQIK